MKEFVLIRLCFDNECDCNKTEEENEIIVPIFRKQVYKVVKKTEEYILLETADEETFYSRTWVTINEFDQCYKLDDKDISNYIKQKKIELQSDEENLQKYLDGCYKYNLLPFNEEE